WLSAALASRIGGTRVPDAQTGFRALSRRAAEAVCPAERGYDFETAFLLEALALGLRVVSVAVPTIYEGRPSPFRRWRDTWRQARGRHPQHLRVVRGRGLGRGRDAQGRPAVAAQAHRRGQGFPEGNAAQHQPSRSSR